MAVETVESITQRIRDIYDLIDGLKVFQFTPRNVNDTSLPCVIVWPSNETPNRIGDADVSLTQTWLGIVLLEKSTFGAAGEKEEAAQTFDIFGKVRSQFWTRRRLQLPAAITGRQTGIVDNAQLASTGLIVRPYPFNSQNLYIGVDFTHTVNYVQYFPEY